MRESQLIELQGTSILTKSFFNKLIRRIEATKPLAGNLITIAEKDNGFEVSIEGYNPVTLNVCSGGVETEILVLAKAV
jgi:hypothetical protein